MPPDLASLSGLSATTPSNGVPVGAGQAGAQRPAEPRQVFAAVQAAVERIRENLASPERTLEFQADAATSLVVVTIKDARTGKAIKRIPGDTLVRFADALTSTDMGTRGLIDLTA